ncbi:MAG: heme-binding protein [Pseudomonadota bacterium]
MGAWRGIAVIGGGAALLAAGWLGAAWIIDDVERPDYALVSQDGAIELRRYGPMLVAEIDAPGARRDAVSAAFRPLANYIFAKERDGEAIAMTAPVTQAPREPIAMTAPVTQTRSEGAELWTVRFVMPAAYDLDSLPRPTNPAVRLVEEPAALRAAIRFSGRASDAATAAAEERLRAWIAAAGLRVAGPPVYAY